MRTRFGLAAAFVLVLLGPVELNAQDSATPNGDDAIPVCTSADLQAQRWDNIAAITGAAGIGLTLASAGLILYGGDPGLEAAMAGVGLGLWATAHLLPSPPLRECRLAVTSPPGSTDLLTPGPVDVNQTVQVMKPEVSIADDALSLEFTVRF